MVAKAYRIATLLHPIKSALIKDSRTIEESVNRIVQSAKSGGFRKSAGFLPDNAQHFQNIPARSRRGAIVRKKNRTRNGEFRDLHHRNRLEIRERAPT